jgi:signal transduction histidine kinase
MTIDPTSGARTASHEVLWRLSHELRTPLNSVIGFSRVLGTNRAGNQRAEDLAMLERIRASGERLLDLVEDLFDVSAPTPSAPTLVPVNVAAAAATAVRENLRAASQKGLTLDFVVEADGMVSLDAARLLRVLRKLVSNAVKFTQAGGVVVIVRAHAGAGAPASVTVRDSGIGIPAELQAAIFEPFVQADGGTRRAHEGAGLGLSVARSLAESMNCRLTLESEPGSGSQFVLHLPVQHSERG